MKCFMCDGRVIPDGRRMLSVNVTDGEKGNGAESNWVHFCTRCRDKLWRAIDDSYSRAIVPEGVIPDAS